MLVTGALLTDPDDIRDALESLRHRAFITGVTRFTLAITLMALPEYDQPEQVIPGLVANPKSPSAPLLDFERFRDRDGQIVLIPINIIRSIRIGGPDTEETK